MHPWLVRNLITPLLERALGRDTLARRRDLAASERLAPSQLRALQARRLEDLLAHAQERCPYYRRLFTRCDVRPVAQDAFAALARLPLLDKDTVRANTAEMLDLRVPGGPIPFNTGGSTGDPLQFYLDRSRIAADKAARMLTHAWFGAAHGHREAYLWGSPIELRAQDRLKGWRDGLTNELLLNAFDLRPETMARYLRILARFKPTALFAYPSSLVKLVQYARSSAIAGRLPGLRVVFTTGERLERSDRDLLQDHFAVPVADGYGSRDGGFIAHECPAGAMHVVDPHVVVELVAAGGRPAHPGEPGEVVVTHLASRAMPLLRYRTGDWATASAETCPCGRSWGVLRDIAGRQTDHLVAANGAFQHGLSAIYAVREIAAVRAFQVRQKADRSVDVLVVPTPEFRADDARRITASLQRRLGEGLSIRVQAVEEIPPLASGKYRHVISEAAAASRRTLAPAAEVTGP